MKDLIKRYWDIFGGTIGGIGLSIIANFKLDGIQLIYSVIILILVCIGLFKVLKNSIDKSFINQHKVLLDKIVDNQRHMKAIKMANEPTQTGEELGNVLIDTMKGGKKVMQKIKNVFVWIGKYWQQIIGLLGTLCYACIMVYAFVFDKFEFILQYLPQGEGWEIGTKIAVGVISVIFVIFSVRNQVKWVGIGSIEQANQYLQELATATETKLSSSAKENIKNALKQMKAQLKGVGKTISSIKKEITDVEKEIASLKELLQIGLSENQVRYNDLMSKKNKLNSDLAQKQNEEANLKTNINKYKELL